MKFNKLNSQLVQLLKNAGIEESRPPSPSEWEKAIESISSHINHIESDREILSHSLEASSAAVHETSDHSMQLESRLLENEAELRAFIASTPLGLFLSDSKGNLSYVNNRFCEITGFKAEESLNRDWIESIHPDDRQEFLIRWHQLQHNPSTTIRGDLRFGIREAWGHVNMAAINIKGNVLGYLGTIDDVNERKRAESLLEGEKLILEMMVRNSGQKTILESILQLIENQGHTIYACVAQFVNQNSLIHLASINVSESLHPAFSKLDIDKKAFEELFSAKPESGEKQVYNISRDSAWAPLCDQAALLGFEDQYALPIIDSHGQALGVFLFFHREHHEPKLAQLEIFEFFNDLFSITIEKSYLEEKLLQEQMKLISSSKMASLGEMAGGIAHEIMNPIAIIDGFSVRLVRMLESGQIDKETITTAITKIRATVERITKIITSLRNYARDGENDAFTEVKIADVINDTLEFCRQKIGYRKIELRVDPIDANLALDCRPIQISQVILNLLSNSADAVEALADRWIQIQVSQIKNRIQVRVVDSGPGIRQEIQDKIMKPYFTTKPAGKGTGLGLSISRAIVESHRGTLTIDKSCANTCFILDLPQRQVISRVKAA